VGMWRVDTLQPDGTVRREQRSQTFLGLSERTARAAFQPILDARLPTCNFVLLHRSSLRHEIILSNSNTPRAPARSALLCLTVQTQLFLSPL
jgi:hypothetical protein